MFLFDKVSVVTVGDLHDNRATCGDSAFDAAQKEDAIALDVLPATAAVSTLPADKVSVDLVFREREARGKAFDYYCKGGAV